ncbi:hypothetical protein PGT21_009757 [Puccinia graminis f. sp. tritici]|uniref:Uncharacterized protein n=1 Tax=Puccinia graminis f. sp. tritici TaxID=56615 RepID=A0A5B0NTM4_PUCGR|nr:hypothetical protein PGT21_009757 [Puccinia graminis f. sp. tritici]
MLSPGSSVWNRVFGCPQVLRAYSPQNLFPIGIGIGPVVSNPSKDPGDIPHPEAAISKRFRTESVSTLSVQNETSNKPSRAVTDSAPPKEKSNYLEPTEGIEGSKTRFSNQPTPSSLATRISQPNYEQQSASPSV